MRSISRSRTAACIALSLAATLGANAALAQSNDPSSAPPAKAAPGSNNTRGNNAPGNNAPPANAPPAAKPAPAPAPAPGSGNTAAPGNAPSAADEDKLVYVTMKTTKGDIVIELNREKAPISVANFLSYVDRSYYDGLIFHRVMDGFMIQGGGFNKDMVQKATDKPIKNEWQNGLKNKRGTIAMARTNQPDTATSQFFINVVDNGMLDQPQRDGAAYAVFGKVVAGMGVVDAIKGVATKSHPPHQNVPVEPIVIESVTKITAADAHKAADAEKKPATP